MEAVLVAGTIALALAVLAGYLAVQHDLIRRVADALEPRDDYARELQDLCEENDRLLASIHGDGAGGRPT